MLIKTASAFLLYIQLNPVFLMQFSPSELGEGFWLR